MTCHISSCQGRVDVDSQDGIGAVTVLVYHGVAEVFYLCHAGGWGRRVGVVARIEVDNDLAASSGIDRQGIVGCVKRKCAGPYGSGYVAGSAQCFGVVFVSGSVNGEGGEETAISAKTNGTTEAATDNIARGWCNHTVTQNRWQLCNV